MISGAHMVIYSADAEADRAFFRDVFALPPSEIAFHPAMESGKHEVYLMCDDVSAALQTLARCGVSCDPISDEGWGLLTRLSLPGGGKIGLYQPRHKLAPR